MTQDPRTMDDTVNYSLFIEKFSHVTGNPKRYATYFPSKASIQTEQQHDAPDDDDSTWEFSAPISRSSRSSSSTSCTSTCTPAQDVISRYRSGMSLDTRSTSPSLYSEPDSWEMTPPSSPTPDQGIKARYRQSRYDALQNTVCQFLSGVSGQVLTLVLVSGSSWCCPSSWSKTKRKGCLQSTWLPGYTRKRRGFNVSPSHS
jgi:hypothetical protein